LDQLPGGLDVLAGGGALADGEADDIAAASPGLGEIDAAAGVQRVQQALVERVEGGLVEAGRAVAEGEKGRLALKAKIAVAMHDELGRVPKDEEVEQVLLLTRVMYTQMGENE